MTTINKTASELNMELHEKNILFLQEGSEEDINLQKFITVGIKERLAERIPNLGQVLYLTTHGKYPLTVEDRKRVISQFFAITDARINKQISAFNPKVRGFIEFEQIRKTERKSYLGKYIAEQSMTMLIGRAGSHKSFIMLDMAMAIVSGRKWLSEFDTSKCPVLIVDEENGEWTFAKRASQLARPGESYEGLYWLSMESLFLNVPEKLEWFKNYLEEHSEIKIIFVDSFRRIASIDENDSEEVNAFLNECLKPIITDLKVSIVILHHLRKKDKKAKTDLIDMEDARGSGDIGAMADNVLILANSNPEKTQMILLHDKARLSVETPPQNIAVVNIQKDEKGEDAHLEFVCMGEVVAKETQEEKAVKTAIKWWDTVGLDKTWQRRDIVTAWAQYGIEESLVDATLGKMRKQAFFEDAGYGKYKRERTLRSDIA